MCDWFGFDFHKIDLVWINNLKLFSNHILIDVIMILLSKKKRCDYDFNLNCG